MFSVITMFPAGSKHLCSSAAFNENTYRKSLIDLEKWLKTHKKGTVFLVDFDKISKEPLTREDLFEEIKNLLDADQNADELILEMKDLLIKIENERKIKRIANKQMKAVHEKIIDDYQNSINDILRCMGKISVSYPTPSDKKLKTENHYVVETFCEENVYLHGFNFSTFGAICIDKKAIEYGILIFGKKLGNNKYVNLSPGHIFYSPPEREILKKQLSQAIERVRKAAVEKWNPNHDFGFMAGKKDEHKKLLFRFISCMGKVGKKEKFCTSEFFSDNFSFMEEYLREREENYENIYKS